MLMLVMGDTGLSAAAPTRTERAGQTPAASSP